VKDTRFIFVEGIMGSGKSTTAWFLTEQLQQNGIAARFLAEGPTFEEPEHPLRIAPMFPHPNAIWLDLTVEEFVETSLQKWRDFVQAARQGSRVIVCDGLLFHGNMTDLFLMNANISVLQRYVAQVVESLQPLSPVVIYFYHADIARAIRSVCNDRGEQWEAYQINWKVASPYGVQRSLHGFGGLVQLYQTYREICDDIFTQIQLPKLAIRNEGDWATYYQDILAFLQLPPTPISL
jgi:deoxyadenosine/deoxycytidine kinase